MKFNSPRRHHAVALRPRRLWQLVDLLLPATALVALAAALVIWLVGCESTDGGCANGVSPPRQEGRAM